MIIGTPGRVMDHMRRKTIRTSNIKLIVLDEADEMLNMGFREDIETILKDARRKTDCPFFCNHAGADYGYCPNISE